MILVASPSKPFAYTDKGTLKRPLTTSLYEEEIQAAYSAVENSSQTGIDPPSSWEYPDVLEFVRKVVAKVLERELQDDDDIFQSGGDRYVELSTSFSV